MSNQPLREEHLNPVFKSMAQWVLAHRWLTLCLAALVTRAAMAQLVLHPLVLDNRPEVFEPAGSTSTVVLSELREEFGRDDLFLLIIEGDVFSLDFLRRLDALTYRHADEVAPYELSCELKFSRA